MKLGRSGGRGVLRSEPDVVDESQGLVGNPHGRGVLAGPSVPVPEPMTVEQVYVAEGLAASRAVGTADTGPGLPAGGVYDLQSGHSSQNGLSVEQIYGGFRIGENETHYFDVMEQLFNWRLVRVPKDADWMWDRGYCYYGKGVRSLVAAAIAAQAWIATGSEEPDGWDKDVLTGRYRNPDIGQKGIDGKVMRTRREVKA